MSNSRRRGHLLPVVLRVAVDELVEGIDSRLDRRLVHHQMEGGLGLAQPVLLEVEHRLFVLAASLLLAGRSAWHLCRWCSCGLNGRVISEGMGVAERIVDGHPEATKVGDIPGRDAQILRLGDSKNQ